MLLPENSLFSSERENTDKSLDAEREKATRSLDKANAKSQDQTDVILKDERSIADQQTATSRADHDNSRQANAGLVEERRRTDVATEVERTRMDEVLLAERETTSRLVAKVLEQERNATDHNLQVERTTTDENCVDSTNLLKAEVANHQATQGKLTSREEFLAIVSHDLRNPIGAVAGYADLLLQGEGDTVLGPESQSFVAAIKRNADISLRLIADLLDLERISHGKLELTYTKFDARKLIESVIGIYKPLALEKKVLLVVELPNQELMLEGDHDRILQVVSNLVGNAMKYTPAEGTITIAVAMKQSLVEFRVKDTGSGIPADKQAGIFERFAQLRSEDRTGLGLGLYIAKTIVESHGGELTVESLVGKGSTFRFGLPLNVRGN